MTREEMIVSRDCYRYIADEIEMQTADKLKLLWKDVPQETVDDIDRRVSVVCQMLRVKADNLNRGLDMKGG